LAAPTAALLTMVVDYCSCFCSGLDPLSMMPEDHIIRDWSRDEGEGT